MLLARKRLVGTGEQSTELKARFGGNGRALKLVGESIRGLFCGDIGAYVQEVGAKGVFGGIRRLLSANGEFV